MMKVVIVEDDADVNKIITALAKKCICEKQIKCDVISFDKYNDKLESIIYDSDIKIYILDINIGIGNLTGIDISRKIRGSNDWNSLIIISSYLSLRETFNEKFLWILGFVYKFDDFDNNMVGAINLALDIIIQKSAIQIKEDNIEYSILISDILYIIKETSSKYCIIKTIDNEFRVRKTLKQLENDTKLTQIKKYLLINKNNTISINDEIIFRNNEKIKID